MDREILNNFRLESRNRFVKNLNHLVEEHEQFETNSLGFSNHPNQTLQEPSVIIRRFLEVIQDFIYCALKSSLIVSGDVKAKH